jgi:hypothetical protein
MARLWARRVKPFRPPAIVRRYRATVHVSARDGALVITPKLMKAAYFQAHGGISPAAQSHQRPCSRMLSQNAHEALAFLIRPQAVHPNRSAGAWSALGWSRNVYGHVWQQALRGRFATMT